MKEDLNSWFQGHGYEEGPGSDEVPPTEVRKGELTLCHYKFNFSSLIAHTSEEVTTIVSMFNLSFVLNLSEGENMELVF